jgi:hypothetical protein
MKKEMKLREFNASNTQVTRSGTPCMSVNYKTGVFSINQHATSLIGLKAGDQIQFLQDENEPENWYLEKVKSGGFEIRTNSNITPGLLFNNTAIGRKVIEGLGGGGVISIRLLVAGEPTIIEKRKLWGLIAVSKG